jgi:tetratricopeptide (TPR) repeat protein
MNKLQQSQLVSLSILGLVVIIFTTLGYATYERNKVWQAEETLWLDAARKAPASARPLAVLALKLGWGANPTEAKYQKALELIERSLSLKMSRSGGVAHQLGNMASIYSKLGNHNEAIAYYKKAIAAFPEDASIRYNYCKTLIMTGNFSLARKELETILDKGFVHADYFNMLGFIHLWTGHPHDALPAIQQAMKYAPGRPDILLTLGKCFSLLGYHEKARWFFSRTRASGRNDAIVSLCIIEDAIRNGETKFARDELQRSIKRFPLSYYFEPMKAKLEDRYREVPLSNDILIPFFQSELPTITTELLP